MLTKTTLSIPKDLLEEAKLYALLNKTSLSEIFVESLKERLNKGDEKTAKLKDVIGTIKVDNYKEPYKRRSELYEDD